MSELQTISAPTHAVRRPLHVWIIALVLLVQSAVGLFTLGSTNIAVYQPGGVSGAANVRLFWGYTWIIAVAFAAPGIVSGIALLRGRHWARLMFLWYWPAALLVQWFFIGMRWSNPLAWPMAVVMRPLFAAFQHVFAWPGWIPSPPEFLQLSVYEGQAGIVLLGLGATFLLLGQRCSAYFGRRVRMDTVNRIAPLLVLVCIYALFGLIAPARFSDLYQAQTLLRQSAVVSVAGLGMTIIMIAGGIDLSIGSMVALVTMVVASTLNLEASGVPLLKTYPCAWPACAAGAGVLIAAAAGLFNGAAVVALRIVPFIVTLGSLLILRGLAEGVGGSRTINPPANLPNWLAMLLERPAEGSEWMIFAPGVWLAIALAFLVGLVLEYTRFGRHVFAIGSSEQTARLCGVAVGRVKLLVYTLGASLTGIAGVMQFARLGQGDPSVAVGLELDVIAAVVIGGGSLAGGEGSVLGTIMGALIMGVISAGCQFMGMPAWVQKIVTGGVLIAAAGFDRMRQERLAH